MTHVGPIEVVLLSPARAHPLGGALRAIVERVARRPGVRLIEQAEGSVLEPVGPTSDVRFVVGLEVGSSASTLPHTLALGLDASDAAPTRPTWVVPASAFGQTIDGVERVQRLGSLLAACLDLASTGEGRELMRTDATWSTPGVMHALAGTAHLSAHALQEALARALARRTAALLATSLEEGREWAIDDWQLPAELDVASLIAAVRAGDAPDVLRAQALAAAEGLAQEVASSIDQALATHGLAALIPLQAALERLIQTTRATAPATAPLEAAPSDVAVRAAEARWAAQPRPLPGAMLLAFGWAAPSGALAGVALGPSITGAMSLAGAGYALAAAAGTVAFVALAGLARLTLALRTRLLRDSLATARADYKTACAALERSQYEALGPEIASGALAWFRDRLQLERRRLTAVEAQVRSLGRSLDATLSEPSAHARDIDAAVDLAAAKALLDPAPEPLVQRVRGEIGGPWRESLPTLIDLLGAARTVVATSTSRAPWVERSDLAKALTVPLAQALATVGRGLERRVAHGLPVRRTLLVPAPFLARELGVDGDIVVASGGDAHLLVSWRPSVQASPSLRGPSVQASPSLREPSVQASPSLRGPA